MVTLPRGDKGLVSWALARFGSLPVTQPGRGPWGPAASWTLDMHLAPKAGRQEVQACRRGFEPGGWRRRSTHRSVGEQGEGGRGEVGVGRSGRADAPSSSGSKI